MATARSKPRKKPDRQVAASGGSLSSLFSARQNLWLGLLLAVVTLAVYFPVTAHPFVDYDDGFYVISNDHIKHGLDLETVRWAFTTFDAANWHPLTWLSHVIDWQFYGSDPGGHHITNLLLHLLNVVLLFWVLVKATGSSGRSFMVAALFALHPLNVETVAWVAERKNLLSMLFFLLALEAYRRYVEEPGTARYVAIAVCFVLGLMAKPQVITLPFVLLLWDYWPLQRLVGKDQPPASTNFLPQHDFLFLLKEKSPLLALSAADAIITVIAQRTGGAMAEKYYFPFGLRIENAVVSYVKYIGMLFWPVRLAPFYPHPNHLPLWQVAASFLLLVAITILVVVARSKKYLPVGWFWFLGTLIPMIGIVQVGGQAMADRYAYLPFIGLFLMICWCVADFAQARHVPRAWLAGISALFLLCLALVTYHQLGYWADNMALWSHTAEVTIPNAIAHDNIASLLMDQGRTEEAMQHFRQAAAIDPADSTSNIEITMYAQRHGRLPEVIEQYNKLLTMTADPSQRSDMLTNRGFAYAGLKDYGRAGDDFLEAVKLNPQKARAWMGLGVLAQRSGDLARAIDDYSQSVKAHPADVTYVLLADALQKSGRFSEAQAALEAAKVLSKDLGQAQSSAQAMLTK